jgi:hypothetical protein
MMIRLTAGALLAVSVVAVQPAFAQEAGIAAGTAAGGAASGVASTLVATGVLATVGATTALIANDDNAGDAIATSTSTATSTH